MQAKIDRGDFIEHAVFSGNIYGTRLGQLMRDHVTISPSHCSKQAIADVKEQGKVCVLDIDMQVRRVACHNVYSQL